MTCAFGSDEHREFAQSVAHATHFDPGDYVAVTKHLAHCVPIGVRFHADDVDSCFEMLNLNRNQVPDALDSLLRQRVLMRESGGRFYMERPARLAYESELLPDPNPDLPDEIKADFNEARSIVSLSPRGSAALSRLAIDKLCTHLHASGRTIDSKIEALVQQGLPQSVQLALDIVRVVGNSAVHVGKLDLSDGADTAEGILVLVNIIAEVMITHRRPIDEMLARLPASVRQQIEGRANP